MDDQSYTRFIQSLPECPGILGRDRLFHYAVFVPFVFLEGEYHFLFEIRAPHIRQAGEVCFPGGAFESDVDSTIQDTAVRETCEELGIENDQIRLDGRMDSMVGVMGNIIDICVGKLFIDSLDDIYPEPAEVAEVFTVPVSSFLDNHPSVYRVHLEVKPSYFDEAGNEVVLFPAKELGLPERYHKPWGHPHHEIFVYDHTPHIIWGITARIVRELALLLRVEKPQ